MKGSKIVTPVLLYFMIILLLITIYYNFAFKPLKTEIEALNMESKLLKIQRMEIELAMLDEKDVRKDIEVMKGLLKEDNSIYLIDGRALADDINAHAKETGVIMYEIIIGEPELEKGSSGSHKTLLRLPGKFSFINTYEKAVELIESFEDSQTGAYLIEDINGCEDENGLYLWEVAFSLYYFGDPETIKEVTEEDEASKTGEPPWTIQQ
ncbi:MAG: hypothetical protein PHR60_03780 [Eubacteriales bacterium]|nr:hypothetical protein [Eubacteriales bacterium]MDD4583292.1 hypothetical protein [Eubacteriales bacterium]